MKAQSAIEYLTTYGWMLLALAIISGSIYSIIGNQCIDSSTGLNGQDIRVENFGGSSESGNLSLLLQTQNEDQVEIQKINVSGPENSVESNNKIVISSGDSRQIEVRGFENSESCNTLDLEIVYDVGNLENLYVSGEITSNIEVTDEMAPEPFSSVTAELS